MARSRTGCRRAPRRGRAVSAKRLACAFLAALLAALACHRKPLARIERDQTRPAAEWLREESISLLHRYVRINTTEQAGEQAGAEFLKQFLDCEGIDSEIVCPAPRRCNLLARLPGKRREGALLLLNHIDVVEVYPQFWKEAPPFEGTIRLGYLYGRGAYDMKSLAISQLLAMVNLKRHGIVPASDVLFLAEASEEHGQLWGSRWLLEHRPEWFTGVAAILNEGGVNEQVLRSVRFWGLETLQTGLAVLEFESDNSSELERLAARFPRESVRGPVVALHPHVVQGFDMLANHLVSPLTDPLRHLDRVVRDPKELAALPDRYAALLEPRAGWSPVFTRPSDSGAPGKPHILYVVTVPPGVDPALYSSPVLKASSEFRVRIAESFASGPSLASPYPTPFTDLLRRVTEVHFPGVPFGPLPVWGAYTTSALFRQRGFAAYGYSPIPVNVYDEVRRHGNDERIFLRDYLDGVALFTDILEEWATNPPVENSRVSSLPATSH